jgi:PAS domain S-box-containing protein
MFPSKAPGLDIAVPVYVEGSPEKWGMVRVGLSLKPVYAEVNRTRTWVIGSGVVVLVLAIVVARLLTQRITGPLERLVEATGELAKGNFDYRVGLRTGDEIEDLSRKFDQMSALIMDKRIEVEQTNQELAALNANLEEKVTERTQAVAEAEEKYRLLVEQSPNAICIIQDGRLKFFNKAFSKAFGYSTEELTAKDWLFLDFMDNAQQDEMRGALDSSLVVSREIVGRHKSGSRIFLDMRSIWVSYEGSPALEAILVDVTEQRQMQNQVVAYERLRALGEMASGVAHDFNNVLGAILGRAQLLQRREVSDEVMGGLRIIEKAAQDGSATVKRIQEFSRVRTDREFAPLDLNAVLEDSIEMTRSHWEDEAHRSGKEIEVARHLGMIPRMDGNISELRELFINFILNAVDAISNEGTITVGTHQEGERVVVAIADSGRGMSQEVQQRLFDPFFSTKGSGGTGLGMSIAYGTIQRHGGQIQVTSSEGAGTTFSISFPFSSDQEDWEDGPDSRLIEGASGRVLVVDDEEDVRVLVADIIREGGFEVETASGGAEALGLAKGRKFDVLVTDLGMPGMSGWEVARSCREQEPDISVILLTGWGATIDAGEAERAGVDRVLKKPFDMKELLRAVHELMADQGLAESA